MKEKYKTNIANGWLSLMWIGFATLILNVGVTYPIIFWSVIGVLLIIRMTIWAVNHVKSL